jgi:DNA-binding FrmR family transcriptional regulator
MRDKFQYLNIKNTNQCQSVKEISELMKHQNIYNRLRRIEGQIRGIEEMVAKERADVEIIVQLEAARSSLASTISTLVESMIEKNEEGSIIIDNEKAQSILRLIKKN